ncbi:hypothetical protein ACVWWN_002656 [Mycobacterium sp. URHB0021]|jgi:hypothetical protein
MPPWRRPEELTCTTLLKTGCELKTDEYAGDETRGGSQCVGQAAEDRHNESTKPAKGECPSGGEGDQRSNAEEQREVEPRLNRPNVFLSAIGTANNNATNQPSSIRRDGATRGISSAANQVISAV